MKKAPISGSFFVLTIKKKELRFEVRELRFRGFAALLQNPSVTAVTSPFEKGDLNRRVAINLKEKSYIYSSNPGNRLNINLKTTGL